MVIPGNGRDTEISLGDLDKIAQFEKSDGTKSVKESPVRCQRMRAKNDIKKLSPKRETLALKNSEQILN